MRFERDGWLHIEPWEIWLELTEHPENEDDRTIWYQDMHGIWKKAEVNDHSIKIPATAFHIEYEGSKKKTICLLDGRLLQKIPDIV